MKFSTIVITGLMATGAFATKAHAQDICYGAFVGSLGQWRSGCDGEKAGTTGQKRTVNYVFVNTPSKGGQICYRAHVQDHGWLPPTNQAPACNGAVVGVANKRVEAVRLFLTSAPSGHSNHYRAHVESQGWQAIRNDGQVAGTTTLSKRMEAFEVHILRPGEGTVAAQFWEN